MIIQFLRGLKKDLMTSSFTVKDKEGVPHLTTDTHEMYTSFNGNLVPLKQLLKVTQATVDYTLSYEDDLVVYKGSTNGAFTLPTTHSGKVVRIKNFSDNHLKITHINGIDGKKEIILTNKFTSLDLTTDGNEWFII